MKMAVQKYALFLVTAALFATTFGKDPWWQKIAQQQGTMVCADERVKDTGRKFSTPWTGGQLCGSETIIRYSCCYGFNSVPGERGCPLVKPLKNLAETALDLGAKRFIQQAEQSGLLPSLLEKGAYTLFLAKDSAFRSLTKEQEKALNSSKRSRSRPPVLLYTVAEGRVAAEDLPDSLTTLYREGSVLISKFPNGLTAVNCIPLISTNIEATNGIIHLTESLLLPTGRSSIPDVLARTPALSTTAATVVRAQVANELRDKRPITIFAPTDQAWESLPQNFMEAIMEDSSALKVLLQYHIIDGVWCPAIASSEAELKTLEGSILKSTCNESGHYINDARIIYSDHKAGNGYIHHIDMVLLPDKVLSLSELLELRNMKYFMKLAETGDVLSLLQRPDSYTIFAPSDAAFEALPNDTLSDLLNQSSLARSVVSYHIAPGRILSANVIDGQKVSPLIGLMPLRLKLHKKRLTVETSHVQIKDLETRNGVLHIIDRVLTPPTLSILQLLEEGNYSIFTRLLNNTEPNLLKLFENSSATFTVFAPSDTAMNEMPPGMIERMLADPLFLYKTMAQHILTTFAVSSSLDPLLIYSFETVNNDYISLTKESDGSMTVARLAEIIQPDILAINGVIHEVSRLIQM